LENSRFSYHRKQYLDRFQRPIKQRREANVTADFFGHDNTGRQCPWWLVRRANIERCECVYCIYIRLGQLGQSDFCICLPSGRSDLRDFGEWKAQKENKQTKGQGRDGSSDAPPGINLPVNTKPAFPGASESWENIFVLLNSLL
jgi:hypothetical protein